jgi:DNA-binding protein HU-beta
MGRQRSGDQSGGDKHVLHGRIQSLVRHSFAAIGSTFDQQVGCSVPLTEARSSSTFGGNSRSLSVDQMSVRRYGPVASNGTCIMSKAFLAATLQDSLDCTGVAANQAAADLIDAIVREMKKEGGFTLPSFGAFTVKKTKARKALNPRTGEGEGRQDSPLQGQPEPQKGSLRLRFTGPGESPPEPRAR